MIIGGVSVWLRTVPEKLWHWVVRQTTMMITVNDDDAAFVWVKEWFLEQEFLKKIRHLDLDTTMRNECIAMIPAPGMHWFWYRGRPFQVWFSRTENTRERISRRMESLTFQTLGRKRVFLQAFVDDVVSLPHSPNGSAVVSVHLRRWLGLCRRLRVAVARLGVLQPGEKEHLIADVKNFRASKQRYTRLGIPYHRGYLLYGPPGTGKTSLVSALAAHFALSIYVVNLTDFTDRSLMNAVNQVPANSVLLFDDIDCAKSGKARESANLAANGAATQTEKANAVTNGVTLSGLLNVLDGFYAPANVLFVMTTNHIEVLDEALLRPGRIDYKLFLGAASASEKIELYRRFFPQSTELEARDFVETHFAETMAEFQGLLLAVEQGDRLDPVTSDHGILV